MMRYLSTLFVLAGLAACQVPQQAPERGVRFATDQAAYAPGADVQLQLENQTEGPIGYNLCVSALERETETGWLPEGEAEICTMVQHGLEPRDGATYTKRLGTDLPPGRYRFVTDIEYQPTGQREQHATDPFSVGGAEEG